MVAGSFSARCKRGHELIEFTDPAAFEAHMTTGHGKRGLTPGGARVTGSNPRGKAAPGWRLGKPEAPYAWKAPSVPRDHEARLAKVLYEYETVAYGTAREVASAA